MIKLLIAAIISLSSVTFAAEPALPDEQLRALPVHVRYDANQFYGKTYDLLMTPWSHNDNPYRHLIKGIIFGKTFEIMDISEIDSTLKSAVNSLVSIEELQSSKRFLSELTGCSASTGTPGIDRGNWRAEFKRKVDLDNLYNDGNIYAIFVEGLLGFDEASEGSVLYAKSISELELAAHHLCLPALRFCNWLYETRGEDNQSYRVKYDAIRPNRSVINSSYFDSAKYVKELISNTFGSAYYIDSSSSFLHGLRGYGRIQAGSGLPVIDTLDKVKKSIFLLAGNSYKGYQFAMWKKLTESSGDISHNQSALGSWEKAAVILSPTMGILGGAAQGFYTGETSAIIPTIALVPPAMYGIYKALSTKPICRVTDEDKKHQISLISLHLTLKRNLVFMEDEGFLEDEIFVNDTQTVLNVFSLGLNDGLLNQFKRLVGYEKLTLSQMVLRKVGAL